MASCWRNFPRDSVAPNKSNELSTRGQAIAQDSEANTQDNEASNRPGFATLNFSGPSLRPALVSAPPPSTKEIFKQFMQTYMETVQKQAQLQSSPTKL